LLGLVEQFAFNFYFVRTKHVFLRSPQRLKPSHRLNANRSAEALRHQKALEQGTQLRRRQSFPIR
jgi:hypothetical protein